MPHSWAIHAALWYLAFTEAWERFSLPTGCKRCSVATWSKYLLLPGRVQYIIGFDSSAASTWALKVRRSPPRSWHLRRQRLPDADLRRVSRRPLARPAPHRSARIALTMAAGHFLAALRYFFYFALLCLVLGCGMFQGATSPARLAHSINLRTSAADAFQIFYLGILAGVIVSPFHCRNVGRKNAAGTVDSLPPESACSSPSASTFLARNICAAKEIRDPRRRRCQSR